MQQWLPMGVAFLAFITTPMLILSRPVSRLIWEGKEQARRERRLREDRRTVQYVLDGLLLPLEEWEPAETWYDIASLGNGIPEREELFRSWAKRMPDWLELRVSGFYQMFQDAPMFEDVLVTWKLVEAFFSTFWPYLNNVVATDELKLLRLKVKERALEEHRWLMRQTEKSGRAYRDARRRVKRCLDDLAGYGLIKPEEAEHLMRLLPAQVEEFREEEQGGLLAQAV